MRGRTSSLEVIRGAQERTTKEFWPKPEYKGPNHRRELAKVSLGFLTDRGGQSIDLSVDESKPDE